MTNSTTSWKFWPANGRILIDAGQLFAEMDRED
jgi:hypothetical protein